LLALGLCAVGRSQEKKDGDGIKKEDQFAKPETPSVIKVLVEGNDVKDIADIPPDVLKSLTAASRGAASFFPKPVLQAYDAQLARSPAPSGALAQGIVKYCNTHLSKQVGDGQCATLIVDAEVSVGARRFPPYGLDADYVWGNREATLQSRASSAATKILPGDLLQFRNTTFKGKFSSGGSTWTWSYSAGHHSAVVAAVSPDHQLLKVYESNVNGNLRTQYGYYALGDMTGGTIWAYRATK
jgi:hypothetical protein